MKFRYYITDLTRGSVVGTDIAEDAENCATSEDFFVVDAMAGEQLGLIGDRIDIQPIRS